MSNGKVNLRTNVWLYSACLVMIVTGISVQLISIKESVILGLVIAIISYYAPTSRGIRNIVHLSVIYMMGYWTAAYMDSTITYLLNQANLSQELVIALSRFSLIGYLLPFMIWDKVQPAQTRYFTFGSFTRPIHFPFIWVGLPNPMWQFLLIGVVVIVSSFVAVIDWGRADFVTLLLYGIVFAFINAILEEFLWRGYILTRFVDGLGERLGLIIGSIPFGMYHYSLGFPWSICALFAVLGMMLGGIAIRSRGLLPVILLHFIMNVLFVLSGLIF
ncbi:membrane protease YdiL (CAAX protease family) [Paenibacillus sp. DS2015]|uniref:CPBP family intramembrane glutamic endopeptidase n=1 Tax=Paenibacillus sp. DS2015 TaxID=3373917 RepID=UPI003D1C649A